MLGRFDEERKRVREQGERSVFIILGTGSIGQIDQHEYCLRAGRMEVRLHFQVAFLH